MTDFEIKLKIVWLRILLYYKDKDLALCFKNDRRGWLV